MSGQLLINFLYFMQLCNIISTVKYYLDKYPNSKIEILIGQKDIDKHISIQYPQSFTGMLSDINVPLNIKQIYHSQDYSDNTENTLYLCYEEQDDIYCCQYCNVICGLEMKAQYNPSDEYKCCEKCVADVDENAKNEDGKTALYFANAGLEYYKNHCNQPMVKKIEKIIELLTK